MDRRVTLRTGSWCGDRTFALFFPAEWEIVQLGGEPPAALPEAEIEARLEQPVEGPSLQEVLTDARSVAIVIDDHTRPTPVQQVLSHLVGRARASGVPDRAIKIVVALGTHVLDDPDIMRRKLGSLFDAGVDIVYPRCDDPTTLERVGVASGGYPILVNRELAEADVRITVSGIYPHDDVGFSGGAKILIGTLGLRTISALHRSHRPVLRGSTTETAFRTELEAVADAIGIDYSVNVVLNHEKEVAEVVSGEFRSAFREAASVARRHFGVTLHPEADVVISNAYPLDTSLSVLGKSLWPFHCLERPRFRILVTALCDCSGRRVPFATSPREARLNAIKRTLGLSQAKAGLRRLRANVSARVAPEVPWDRGHVVYVPHVEVDGQRTPTTVAGARAYSAWDEILDGIRRETPPGSRLRVLVLPYAPLLFPRPS